MFAPQNRLRTRAICSLLLASAGGALGCTATIDGASKGNADQPAATGGTANSSGGAGGGSSIGGTAVSVAPFTPSEPALPRLTTAQYQNVIRDLFGPTIQVPELEPDQRPYSFSIIGASTTTVSEHGVDLYSQAAFGIAKAVFADTTLRQSVVGCAPATPLDDACLGQFIHDFGLRAWRRPVTDSELGRYQALAGLIGRTDPWAALQYVTAAVLQSPSFLYRVELGEADASKPTWLHYTGYEMASRLSFLLRNSFPDADLLAAAARGELATKDGVVAQATRLLDASGPTETMLRALYSEYLDLPLLDNVKFPDAMDPNHTLAASMRNEVLEIVSRIGLREAGDMRTLFNTHSVAVNQDLASLYGLAPTTSTTLAQAELSADGPRAGILTTGALLTLNNRPNRTSPTIRGLFIRQRLLCGTVPPPPPGIPPIMEDDAGPPKTIREKLELHRTNPVCAACHNSMDPIGLGMEDFDQYGRFRTTYDTGQTVDSGGDVDGTAFSGAKQLGQLLSEDPRVTACLAKQLYRYGSARLETDGEGATLQGLDDAFAAHGYQLRPLLLELVGSDGFRFTVEGGK
jgi:Protein of unknown function (DUF1588)/Protein of unknown function (DUF1592)/Protein of unknown function (DUF1595)/Protein of unknown function (DUF1585)/Protein of unknown function (DUF1587)